jgi:hypothetical protein
MNDLQAVAERGDEKMAGGDFVIDALKRSRLLAR